MGAGDNVMIAPKATCKFPYRLARRGSVTFQTVNDYGVTSATASVSVKRRRDEATREHDEEDSFGFAGRFRHITVKRRGAVGAGGAVSLTSRGESYFNPAFCRRIPRRGGFISL